MRSGNKRPQLSDLRESGAIEQDADLVIFIHRPEYYGLDVDDDGNSLKGIAEIIIAKHRNGAVGDVQLKFIREYAKFTDLEESIAVFEDGNGNSTATFQSSLNSNDNPDNSDLQNNGNTDAMPF